MSLLRNLSLLVALVLLPPAFAADGWPQWRGPAGDGSATADGLFKGDALALEKVWSIKLGSSYSGIAVADGRAVTMVARDGKDLVVAFDAASGKELWSYEIGEMYAGHDGSDDGPLGMPVIADGSVYALGARGELFALQAADGKQLWKKSLTKAVGATEPFYGFTTTPVVVDDLLIVQGGEAGKGLNAFDRKSGKLRWSAAELKTEYESPIVAELLGRRQVLTSGATKSVGVDPADGSVLWTLETEGTSSGTPTVLPGDRVLLKSRGGFDLYQARETAGKISLEKLWSTTALKQSYALPVYRDGYLYGYDGRFMACVDAKDGSRVWKSRPPGGKGLILVDGHLVAFGSGGDVVVVAASPDGYLEKARINVSESDSYTAPSFADGRIFVRNLVDFAALKVADSAAPTASAAAPRNEFERFIASLDGASDKTLLIDRFMREQSRFPIVEDDRWIHFVYRGQPEDIALRATFLPSGEEPSLAHVEGTDFYHASFEVDPDTRIEYQFALDFESYVPDPLNPRRVPGRAGVPISEVEVGAYRYFEIVEPFDGPHGRVESFELESALRKNKREVHVYLPHGYGEGERSYPLVVVPDAAGWVEQGRVANTLDRVMAKYTKPAVVAFVRTPGPFWQELGTGDFANYTRLIVEELLPELERRYDVTEQAAERTILGRSHGGVAAVIVALTAPGAFGNAAAYSYWYPRDVAGPLAEAIAKGAGKETRFHLTWNHYDEHSPGGAQDVRRDSAELLKQLTEAGYPVAGGVRRDSTGWSAWSASLAESLGAFYPR